MDPLIHHTASAGFSTGDVLKCKGQIPSSVEDSVAKCASERFAHAETPTMKTNNLVLWSIYDRAVPGPHVSKIILPIQYGMWLADAVLDRSPVVIQQLAWTYLLSSSTYPCPTASLVTGDLVQLSEVGILRFILDKIALEDRPSCRPWLDFRLGPVPMVMPLDPEATLKILNSDKVEKGFAYDRLSLFFGDGIFTSKIESRWKEEREVARRLFLHKELGVMLPTINKTLLNETQAASCFAKDQPVDLVLLLTRMSLLAFCDSILGVDVRDIADELTPAVNCVLAYVNDGLEPVAIPFGEAYQAFIHNRNQVHAWMGVLIARVRENAIEENAPQNTLVAKILDMSSPEEELELIELMIAMLVSGHEGTARLMTSAIYSMIQHPHYIEEVRNEFKCLAEQKQHQGRDWMTSCAQPAALPRLHSIINESLRLFPPAWLIARSPICDIDIKDRRIHKGSQILISFLVLNRLEGIWGENAERFYPERFDNLTVQQKKSFFPFATGAQRCPGEKLARMEASLAIAGLFERFDITLADPTQLPSPTSAGTLRLFQELKVFLSPR